jgi:hypothetical protein
VPSLASLTLPHLPSQGLVELGPTVDTTPHTSFYLAALAALAAPSSLASLFPDVAAPGGGGERDDGGGAGHAPVAIKAAVLPEAIKAIFK